LAAVVAMACSGAARLPTTGSLDGSTPHPSAETSPAVGASANATAVNAPADAPGGRDFRRILRYPGSWISEAHDTYYIYCPDVGATYRDFLVKYATMETDERLITDFFKEQLQRHGRYRVVRNDKIGNAGRTTWNVDLRLPTAHLMCAVSPSDTLEHDVYNGDIRVTVERGESGPTSVQVEILLDLRADSPY